MIAAAAACAAGPPAAAAPATNPAKARFVAAANAECRATITRLKRISHLTNLEVRKTRGLAEVNRMIAAIARLSPPPGDAKKVARLVLDFRRFSAAVARYAQVSTRRDAFPALRQLILTRKEALRAAQAYGLRTCAKLFG